MGDVLPVARFSPAPGILVDRAEKKTTISGAMEMYGPEASAARALSVQNTINKVWTQKFTDGYEVSCSISVRYRGEKERAGNAAQIEVLKMSGPSNVSTVPGMGRKMQLNASGADVFTWVAAHEFGHVLGMDDKYSEGIVSRTKSLWGGNRSTDIEPGYEGNLMGAHNGTMGSQNLADLAAETDPLWINDDDHVRAWVNAHPDHAIAGLSSTSKLKAIRTLMGGYISDDDVAAIIQICKCVQSKPEAVTIRNGIDLTDFYSIGQRQRVRMAMDKMP